MSLPLGFWVTGRPGNAASGARSCNRLSLAQGHGVCGHGGQKLAAEMDLDLERRINSSARASCTVAEKRPVTLTQVEIFCFIWYFRECQPDSSHGHSRSFYFCLFSHTL